jgi:Holliday junction DNA helicase RuvA
MIAHVKGKLIEKNPTYAIVECGGIGYHINISLNTYSAIGDSEQCLLHTELIVREDAQLLYGFSGQSEKKIFQLLISVSGVGPSTALMVLSSGNATEIQEAILTEDVAWFKGVKGIGPKSAQRIIIDLKDKIAKTGIEGNISEAKDNTVKIEALSALVALGFNKNQAEKAITKTLKAKAEASVEEVIKNALKGL